jgi:hypothetical protein
MLMENFLRSKEYWQVVETGFSAAADDIDLSDDQQKAIADQRLKDLRAKNYLFQAIDRSILETILNKETSKGIWDSMKKKGFKEMQGSNVRSCRLFARILKSST